MDIDLVKEVIQIDLVGVVMIKDIVKKFINMNLDYVAVTKVQFYVIKNMKQLKFDQRPCQGGHAQWLDQDNW